MVRCSNLKEHLLRQRGNLSDIGQEVEHAEVVAKLVLSIDIFILDSISFVELSQFPLNGRIPPALRFKFLLFIINDSLEATEDLI